MRYIGKQMNVTKTIQFRPSSVVKREFKSLNSFETFSLIALRRSRMDLLTVVSINRLRLRANRRNNSQHCCANNVGSCCVRVGSGVQTDATTPNNVGTCSASWEEYNP